MLIRYVYNSIDTHFTEEAINYIEKSPPSIKVEASDGVHIKVPSHLCPAHVDA